VVRKIAGQIDDIESRMGPSSSRGGLAGRGDLGLIVVDTDVAKVNAQPWQRMRQQADATTQVQQWRGAAPERIGDTAVQRIAPEFAACVVVVIPMGQEMAGDRPQVVHGHP